MGKFLPTITLDQYKELKRMRAEGAPATAYMRMGNEIGRPTTSLLAIAKRGIKQYDYQIWKEEQENDR